jgi:hypothetical protein
MADDAAPFELARVSDTRRVALDRDFVRDRPCTVPFVSIGDTGNGSLTNDMATLAASSDTLCSGSTTTRDRNGAEVDRRRVTADSPSTSMFTSTCSCW